MVISSRKREEIANERADIKVGKINVDEQHELASEFGIMSIPTLVVMKNGKIGEPHMTKVTCFSAALSSKTKYRRIRL